MATIKPTTVPAKRLSETISGASASFKVNNLLSWQGMNDGSTLLTSADFGTRLWVVFRNSAGTLMEIMEVDPTTITAASSAITILYRGLKFDGTDLTEVAANKLTWVKGDTIVEFGTHVPQLLAQYLDKVNDQTAAGLKIFSSVPQTTGGNPIVANDLARKAYVDAVVAGIATSVSQVVPGTAGETLVAGQGVYFKLSDNRWWKWDADDATTVNNVLLGIAQGAGTAGVAVTNGIMIRGVDTNQSGRVAGEVQYASNTAGGFSNTPGTVEVTVGVAKSATEVYFDPRFNQQITEDQQDALEGTSGTPSSSNKYVTNNDTTGTGSVVRESVLSTIAGTLFGDGNDGNVTIAAGTTTVTRDMYYNNLTIQTGGILNPSGYRIYVKGTLTFEGTGKIARNGNNGAAGGNGGNGSAGAGGTGGSAGTGGAALAAGSISGSIAGGDGAGGSAGTTGGGSNGVAGSVAATPGNITNAVGSSAAAGAGAGGASGGGFNGNSGAAGGVAGTGLSTVTNPTVMPRTAIVAINLHTLVDGTAAFMKGSAPAVGGSSGAGGAGGNQGAGTYAGGGGGGGGGAGGTGGLVMVAAFAVVGGYVNCIQALGGTGGAGGNGGNPTAQFSGGGGTGGGGNGGTGGVVVLLYHTYSGTALDTTCVAGGSGGAAGATAGIAGTGGGAAGSVGTAGGTGATGKLYSFAV